MSLDLSDTQVLYPKPVVAPQAGYQFMQPWYEDYQRRLGASVFGAPGQYSGLIDEPQPIPIEGTAGLTPLEMMARQGAMGAGPYQPGYDTATQLMGEATGGYRGSTGAFNPYTMTSPYYNPYETDVVQDTLERMRRVSAQEDIAGRAQDISSGAFGGSRGRLLAGERQAESERGILGALAGIRGQGFQRAQEAAMNDYARRMSMLSGAAGGLGGIAGQVLGMGGQRQGEMMNWLNMMNQYGGQGRDIYQQELSRMYQAALRKSQEPWERIMRGQALLQGMEPGKLIGGYETKLATPDTWQEPTGLGSVIETGGGIASIIKTLSDAFGWNPFKKEADGGYIQKPKKYNEGGIVSGLVPIQMQDGGGPDLNIPDFILEAGDVAIQNYLLADQMINSGEARQVAEGGRMMTQLMEVYGPSLMETIEDPAREKLADMGVGAGGIEALLMGGTALELISGKGKGLMKPGRLKKLADAANKRRIARKAARDAKKAAAQTTAKGKDIVKYGAQRQDVVPYTAPPTPKTLWGRIKDVLGTGKEKLGKTTFGKYPKLSLTGAAVAAGGIPLLVSALKDRGAKAGEKIDAEELEAFLAAEDTLSAERKRKQMREDIFTSFLSTTGRLDEAMHAPGRNEVTLGDAGRMFAEELYNMDDKELTREYEALARMSKGKYSAAELLDLDLAENLYLSGRTETDQQMATEIFNANYPQGLSEHPQVINDPDVVAGTKSVTIAAAELKAKIIQSLLEWDYDKLKAYYDANKDTLTVNKKD